MTLEGQKKIGSSIFSKHFFLVVYLCWNCRKMPSDGVGRSDFIPNGGLESCNGNRFFTMPLMGTAGAACGGRALKPENLRKFWENSSFLSLNSAKVPGIDHKWLLGALGMCAARSRASLCSPGCENLRNSPKSRGRLVNPLVCLSRP